MSKFKYNLAVIGLGYVGLPLALNLAKKFECVGFDIDKNRIENLKNKNDTNKEFLPKNFINKRIKFTTNLSEIINCNFFIICVPTPITKNKKPNF